MYEVDLRPKNIYRRPNGLQIASHLFVMCVETPWTWARCGLGNRLDGGYGGGNGASGEEIAHQPPPPLI